jgi:hypothetical protein
MDSGTIDRAQFADSVRDARGPVWVRAVLGPVHRRHAPLYAAFIFVGPQPPGWKYVTWRYKSCTLTAVRTTSKRFAAALFSGNLGVGPLTATFEFDPGDLWQWRREPSYSRLDRFGIPWPHVAYDLSLAGLENQRLTELLVGRDAPSFPTSGAALDAFLYGNFEPTGTMDPTLGRIRLHVIDTCGRIRRVAVRPSGLDVVIDGSRVKGAVVELNSPTHQQRKRIAGPGKVSWALPPGTMEGAWLWLKRGG